MSYAPYLSHGITLAFVWYVGITLTACVIVAAAMRAVSAESNVSSGVWLAARLFPTIAAAAFVTLLFAPSYWRYEPREFVEGFDPALTFVAAGGGALVAAGLLRGAAAWRSASRRTAEWLRHAQPIVLAGSPLPAYVIDTSAPMMALVGVLRPRLLVTRGLVDALTAAELAASVAHELGHRHALDNLKRLLMRSAPDVLGWMGAARDIEQRWAAAAERAADREAAGADAHDRCTLASALVKVARLMPIQVPADEPICTLVAGGDITRRVQTLLEDSDTARRPHRPLLAWTAAAIATPILAVAYAPLLHTVHEATELIVRATGANW